MTRAANQQRRARRRVPLETKTLPSQDRSRSTFDAILKFAGEVLAEQSTQSFSINAVCKRSGLTPPAIYRYFPNKYALLKALAERLMNAEDETVLTLMASRQMPRTESEGIAGIRASLRQVVAVTSSFPGSVPILRALRTTPVMREVRRLSTARVAKRGLERLREMFPAADPDRLRRVAWLGLEISNHVKELIVEGECEAVGQTSESIIEEAAVMLGRHYWLLGSASAGADSRAERRSKGAATPAGEPQRKKSIPPDRVRPRSARTFAR